LIISIRMSVLI